MEELNLNKTKQLTEAGIFSVIIAIGMILMFYLPIGQTLLAMMIPLPVIIASVRNESKYTVLSVVVASFVAGFLVTFMASFTLGVFIFSVGYPLGLAIKRRASNLRTVLIGTLGVIIGLLLMMSVTELLTGISLQEALDEMFQLSREMQSELLGVTGNLGDASDESVETINKTFDLLEKMLKMLMPAIIIVFSMILASINLVLSKQILKKMRIDHVPLGAFEDFRYPRHLAYGSAAMLILSYVIGMTGFMDVEMLLSNLVYLFTMMFAVQGAAVLYALIKKRLGKFVSIVFIVLFAVFGMLQYIALFGFFDVLIDIRKLSSKKSE